MVATIRKSIRAMRHQEWTICTSHVERLNLTIRTFMRRFTLAGLFCARVESTAMNVRSLLLLTDAAYSAIFKWIVIVTLWLVVPVFLLAIIAIFMEHYETRPAWAAGNLAVGLAIGSFMLWVTWKMVKARAWMKFKLGTSSRRSLPNS